MCLPFCLSDVRFNIQTTAAKMTKHGEQSDLRYYKIVLYGYLKLEVPFYLFYCILNFVLNYWTTIYWIRITELGGHS